MMVSLVFLGGGTNASACAHTNPQYAHAHQSSTFKLACDVARAIRQYRKTYLLSAFMSPLFLRYIMTANMKRVLFCQKCVNKHGNTSSEGHNSILRDKCSERVVTFRISHKITEQTKVVSDYNDLI